MEQTKFAALMPVIVGGLANRIIKETDISEDEVFDKLYNSKLYSILEKEETKVWTYSVSKLFDLFQSEANTGELEIPEY